MHAAFGTWAQVAVRAEAEYCFLKNCFLKN